MISASDRKPIIKMTGYLEKKSKMRVVCRWKKLWFVLEGRLLLYYKSQLEYLSLSPCRGTVNLGLAASVVPGKCNEIIVSTRSHTVALRALNRTDHDVWLQALLDAMYMPNTNHTICCTKPVHHFRYSTGVLEESERMLQRVQRLGGHAHTLSSRLGNTFSHNFSKDFSLKHHTLSSSHLEKKHDSETELYKGRRELGSLKVNPLKQNSISGEYGLDKLSKKFNKIAVSDTSIPGKFRLTTDSDKPDILRRSASVENDLARFTENIYESVKELELDLREPFQAKRKVVKRSDSDRILTRPSRLCGEFRSDQRILSSDDSALFKPRPRMGNHLRSKESFSRVRDRIIEDYKRRFTAPIHMEGSLKRYLNADIKSDTDLSMKKHPYRKSGSCDAIRVNDMTYKEDDYPRFSEELNRFRAKMLKDSEIMNTVNSLTTKSVKPRRSNSLLRRFSRESSRESYDSGVEIGFSPKKRSLSFLKRMWKKKEKRWETEDESFSTNPNPLFEINGADYRIEELGNYSGLDLSIPYELPQPEPPPDYDEVTISESEPPKLPPRHTPTDSNRSPSPWHDVPSNNRPVQTEPPEVPLKAKKRYQQVTSLDYTFQESTENLNGLRYLFKEDTYTIPAHVKNRELSEMLAKLQEINRTPLENYHYFMDNQSLLSNATTRVEGEDPDYDIPRPHASLLPQLREQSENTESIPATNFFATFQDSLDPAPHRDDFERLTMAPDSLECDPWSLSNETEPRTETWAKYALPTTYTHESLYQDSLNQSLVNRDPYIPFHQKGCLQLYS